jgi:hypothetical protein
MSSLSGEKAPQDLSQCLRALLSFSQGFPILGYQLQRHIVPDNAIWAVIPKKRFARAGGIDFGWSDVQEAALQTDWVDTKVASLSEEEYTARFVIRKDRRGKYAAVE